MEQVIPELGDTIPEDWLKKYNKEARSKFRSITVENFRGKDEVEIHIYHPNQGVQSEAADVYSKTYGKLLKDPDCITRKEALDAFKERGIWGDKEEGKIEDIAEDMKELEIQSATLKRNKGNKEHILALKEKWLALKKEMDNLYSEKSSLLFNTIEHRAAEMETKVKLSRCVKFADGTPVWKTVEDLDKEDDSDAVRRIVNQATRFWFGLAQEIINDLPIILFGGEEDQKIEQDSAVSGDVSVDG